MTFSGFLNRIFIIALLTFLLVSFTGLGWAVYFALMPIFFYEILRRR
jgi:hypothetical protein